MNRSQRMKRIVSLNEVQKSVASQKLTATRGRHDGNLQKLEEFRRYRQEYARALKHFYSLYEQNADLFNVGAYQRGANLELDSAVAMRPQILEFLRQDRRTAVNFSDAVTALAQVTGGDVIDADSP